MNQNPLDSEEMSKVVETAIHFVTTAEEKIAGGLMDEAKDRLIRAESYLNTGVAFMDREMPEAWRQRYSDKIHSLNRKIFTLRLRLVEGEKPTYSDNPKPKPYTVISSFSGVIGTFRSQAGATVFAQERASEIRKTLAESPVRRMTHEKIEVRGPNRETIIRIDLSDPSGFEARFKPPDFDKKRYGGNMTNGEQPPYEPFRPEKDEGGTTITGPKQTRMFRILQIKHGLKLEMLGMRVSRHGSLFAMVKREFGLRGSKQKVYDQFLQIADAILNGRIPLPGYPEQPGEWLKKQQQVQQETAGWKSMNLGDIIPAPGLSRLSSVLKELVQARDEGRLGEINVHQKLLEVLQPYEAEIRAKGVDIKFMAYSLENSFNQKHFGNNPGSEPPNGHGYVNVPGLPQELAKALSDIIKAARQRPGSPLDPAMSYIRPIIDGRVKPNDAEAMGVQLLYIMGNIGTWRGPEAKEAKLIIKKYMKHYEAPGFENNPYIVAGPELRFVDKMPEVSRMIDVKGVTSTLPAVVSEAKVAEEEESEEMGEVTEAEAKVIEKGPPTGGKAARRYKISDAERARRSRFAKRQQRKRGGKFRNNPYEAWVDGADNNPHFITTHTGMVLSGKQHTTLESAEVEAEQYKQKITPYYEAQFPGRDPFLPQVRYTDHGSVEKHDNIDDLGQVKKYRDNPTGFVKVYSDNGPSGEYSTFFRYDPANETVAVRAMRRSSGGREGMECEIKASAQEAKQMYGFIRKHGILTFLKKIGKSPRVVGHRMFKKSVS
jgi:hypothetical protein